MLILKRDKIRSESLSKNVELFDDEPIEAFPYYGDGRDEWVEVDPKTLEEVK